MLYFVYSTNQEILADTGILITDMHRFGGSNLGYRFMFVIPKMTQKLSYRKFPIPSVTKRMFTLKNSRCYQNIR